MRKRLAVVVLTLLMVVTLFPMTAGAYHTHDFGSTGHCSCGQWLECTDLEIFDSPFYMRVADGKTGYMRVHPYAYSNERIGELLYSPSSGTRIIVTGMIENGFGNIWYKVYYNNTEGYIYTENLSYVDGDSAVRKTMTISNTSIPVEIKKGNGFGLAGVINSETKMTKVEGAIYKLENGRLLPMAMDRCSKIWDSTRFDIKYSDSRYSTMNNELTFGLLDKGDYLYVVIATNDVCPWPIIRSWFKVV